MERRHELERAFELARPEVLGASPKPEMIAAMRELGASFDAAVEALFAFRAAGAAALANEPGALPDAALREMADAVLAQWSNYFQTMAEHFESGTPPPGGAAAGEELSERLSELLVPMGPLFDEIEERLWPSPEEVPVNLATGTLPSADLVEPAADLHQPVPTLSEELPVEALAALGFREATIEKVTGNGKTAIAVLEDGSKVHLGFGNSVLIDFRDAAPRIQEKIYTLSLEKGGTVFVGQTEPPAKQHQLPVATQWCPVQYLELGDEAAPTAQPLVELEPPRLAGIPQGMLLRPGTSSKPSP